MGKSNKIIVILGPTSSGKSDVAIRLARKFNGEIISADSRQVYRGMDIGTGKIHGTWNIKHKAYISENIPHYLIDNVSPRTNYNAAKFKRDAQKIIKDILQRGKLPIICGGTGFWIKALVDDVNYPEVKPDWVLRNKLRNKSPEALFRMLQKMDLERAKNIDAKNPVRLIRAIEICKKIKKVPPLPLGERDLRAGEEKKYDFLQIGINLPKEKLHANIKKRLKYRFAQGMLEEVEKLNSKEKLSWKKIESFGLGYFWIPKFLKGKISTEEELFGKIFQAEKDYAKRQMTWWRKDDRIKWLDNYKTIKKEVDIFLQK